MRVAIAALGTRGDVLPYVVLGTRLRAQGHEVLVSTMATFRGLVEGAGLDFHALPGDPSDVFRAGRIDMSPRRPLQHLNALWAAVDVLVRQTDPAALINPWADRDYVIFTGATTFAHPVAQELGARSAMVVMTPGAATGAFAHPVLAPGLSLGAPGNLATWFAAERLQRQMFQEPLKPAERRAWRLPPFALDPRRRGDAWPPHALVHAYSPEVVPRPRDWPAHVAVTGWLLPERSAGPLPDPVERFLQAGDPPVYVGFGSMQIPDPERVARMLVAALRRTGRRAIACGGGLAGAASLRDADAVLVVDEVPHERLFDRVQAVVHHGGSGTVGAGLRAGRPTLIAPLIFDQFFWGARVKELGVGPAPVPFRWLTEDRLTERLGALTSGRYDAAARAIGERIGAEDSAGLAVEALERVGRR